MISINFFADIFRLTAQILRIQSARLLEQSASIVQGGYGYGNEIDKEKSQSTVGKKS